MIQYEYRSVLLSVERSGGFFRSAVQQYSCAEIENLLNVMGKEGWEPVGVFPVTDGGSPAQINQAIHHFKRPLSSP